MVGAKLDGQRVRRNFKNLAVAETSRQQLENAALGLAVQFHLQQTSLTEHQLRQAESAFRAAPGVDLEAAVTFFKAHHPQGSPCPTIASCVAEFLADCEARNFRLRTVGDYRACCQRLVEEFGNRPVNTVTTRELAKFEAGST